MIPFLPNRLEDLANVDVDKVNEDLRTAHRFIDIDRQRRFYRHTTSFLLDGVADTDTLALRKFYLRLPGADFFSVVVESIEVDLTASAGEWTLTCSDTSQAPITTVGGYASTSQAVRIPSSSSDVTWTLSCTVGSTITGGRLVVHTLCDRWQQGGGEVPYDPTTLTSLSPTSVATLNAELTAMTDASQATVDAGNDNQRDIRCDVLCARGLTAGQTLAYRLPALDPTSATGQDFRVAVYVVAAAAQTARVTVAPAAPGATVTVDVVGAGAAILAVSGATLNQDAGNDPTDSTKDTVVTLENHAGAGSVLLVYAVVWWL